MRNGPNGALVFGGGAGIGTVAAGALTVALGPTAGLFAIVVGAVVALGCVVTAAGGGRP